MIAEGRAYSESLDRGQPMRFGAATGLRRLSEWKRSADFLFVQIGFSVEALLAWRAETELTMPVYAGVIVLGSARMARRLTTDIPELEIPASIHERLERDRDAGVDVAIELVSAIRDSGAFEGVHLIPVSRYREVASRLERLL
jgi:5,10-methylenetetrahydrofolate reductase